MQAVQPLVTELVSKAGRLEATITSSLSAFTAFTSCLQRIAHKAAASKGETGNTVGKSERKTIVLVHRTVAVSLPLPSRNVLKVKLGRLIKRQ